MRRSKGGQDDASNLDVSQSGDDDENPLENLEEMSNVGVEVPNTPNPDYANLDVSQSGDDDENPLENLEEMSNGGVEVPNTPNPDNANLEASQSGDDDVGAPQAEKGPQNLK